MTNEAQRSEASDSTDLLGAQRVLELAADVGVKFDPHWGITATMTGTETFKHFAAAVRNEMAAQIEHECVATYGVLLPEYREVASWVRAPNKRYASEAPHNTEKGGKRDKDNEKETRT